MEMKWIAVMFVGFALCMAIPEVVKSYQKGQCQIAAIEKNMAADDIKKLCGN